MSKDETVKEDSLSSDRLQLQTSGRQPSLHLLHVTLMRKRKLSDLSVLLCWILVVSTNTSCILHQMEWITMVWYLQELQAGVCTDWRPHCRERASKPRQQPCFQGVHSSILAAWFISKHFTVLIELFYLKETYLLRSKCKLYPQLLWGWGWQTAGPGASLWVQSAHSICSGSGRRKSSWKTGTFEVNISNNPRCDLHWNCDTETS